MEYGYAWPAPGNEEELKEIGAQVKMILEETNKEDKPQLRDLLERLKPGDTLVIYKLNRLGLTIKQFQAFYRSINKKGIKLKSIKDNPDHDTLKALSDMEKEVIAARTKVGMKKSKSQGRPRKEAKVLERAAQMYYANYPLEEILKTCNLSKSTLYAYLKKTSGGEVSWKRKSKSSPKI